MKSPGNLRRNTGFTLIELLVVIAIIGILCAILAPVLMGGDSRVNAVNNKAKDFYFTAQRIMTDINLSKDNNIKISGSCVIEVRKSTAPGIVVISGSVVSAADFYNYLIAKLNTFINQSDDGDEWYYFAVDDKYRVKAAYMSNTKLTGYIFDEVNYISNEPVGAFPEENGQIGKNITS